MAERYLSLRPRRDEFGYSHGCHEALGRRSKEGEDPTVLPTGVSDVIAEWAHDQRLTSPSSEQVRKRWGELSVTIRFARSA